MNINICSYYDVGYIREKYNKKNKNPFYIYYRVEDVANIYNHIFLKIYNRKIDGVIAQHGFDGWL